MQRKVDTIMEKARKILKEFIESSIPEVSGRKLELKRSRKKDDDGLYFDLPLGEKEEFCAVSWARDRRAAALFREEDFDKLCTDLGEIMQVGGPLRSYARMLMMSAHFCSYEKGLGFGIRPILLDEKWGQWEYIEMSGENSASEQGDDRLVRPFGLIVSREEE